MQRLQPLVSRLTRQGGRSLLQKRGYAADPHGEVKLNCWEAPTNIAAWKEEHIVFVVLAGWGVAIWGGMKAFGGSKKEDAPKA